MSLLAAGLAMIPTSAKRCLLPCTVITTPRLPIVNDDDAFFNGPNAGHYATACLYSSFGSPSVGCSPAASHSLLTYW